MNKKRKAIEGQQQPVAMEKKRLMSVTDVDRHRIRCWCETLHRLSYPRLVNFAASLFSKSKTEIIHKFTKRQLCELLARLPEKFTNKELSQFFTHQISLSPSDLKINDNILDAIENFSSEDLRHLDRLDMPLASDSKCKDAFGHILENEKHPGYSLFNLQDPVTLSLVTDFLRVPTKQKINPWLFNFHTLENLRRTHPFTKEPLSEFQLTGTKVDEKEKNKARHAIREEWGYPVSTPVSEFTMDEKKQQILRHAWQLPQLFQPLQFAMGETDEPEEPEQDIDRERETRLEELRQMMDLGADAKERERRDRILTWLSERDLPPSNFAIELTATSVPDMNQRFEAARKAVQELHQHATTQFGPISMQVLDVMVRFLHYERGQMPPE